MVASPDICRQNGKKSRGPATNRGKAVSSRNAVKHGLLSVQPPLLLTEDVEIFQNIINGLVDEYQPQASSEYLLVQQAAMGWLKLHRAWSAEAATINLAAMRIQWDKHYPRYSAKNVQSIVESATGKSFKVVLQGEKDAIAILIHELKTLLAKFSEKQYKSEQFCQSTLAVLKAAMKQCPEEILQKKEPPTVWKLSSKLICGVQTIVDLRQNQREIDLVELAPAFQNLQTAAQDRRNELLAEDAAMNKLADNIHEARKISEGLNNLSLISRYESKITRRLDITLRQLEEIKNQRNTNDPMGSFGKSDPLKP